MSDKNKQNLDLLSIIYEKVNNINDRLIPSLEVQLHEVRHEVQKNSIFRVRAMVLFGIVYTLLTAIIIPLVLHYLNNQ